MEMSSRIFWQVDPLHPSLQSIVCVWPPPGTHARRAGEGHWGHQPQVQPSGCPGPTPLLSGNLQSLLPFVPLRFQFQWRLMVARLCLLPPVCFILFPLSFPSSLEFHISFTNDRGVGWIHSTSCTVSSKAPFLARPSLFSFVSFG